MARYRKVDPRIWNDAKFMRMSDAGKLAFLFILTHPHMTALGAMRATIPGLAAELGWQLKAFREAFGEALQEGMLEHCESASFVGLPNFIKYNRPESPNVVTAWVGAADLLPECHAKWLCLQRAKAFAKAFGEAFGEAFTEAFAKAMPYPEQEQEQEQEQDNTSSPPKSPVAKIARPDIEAIYQLYPRKAAKQAALKAIAKAINLRSLAFDVNPCATLCDAVSAYADSPAGQPPLPGANDYRPHPATWFNAGRYDDDRSEWQKPNGVNHLPFDDRAAADAARLEQMKEAGRRPE